MKVSAVAIVLLAIVALTLADSPGPKGRGRGRGGKGRGKGKGQGAQKFGCFTVCKDECKEHRRNRINTCYKPCLDKCPKGDKGCRLECKRTIDCSLEGEPDTSKAACKQCKKSDKFQECVKPFRQCARDNCADQCPKPEIAEGEEKKARFGLFKTVECRTCLIDECGHADQDAVESLDDAEDDDDDQ